MRNMRNILKFLFFGNASADEDKFISKIASAEKTVKIKKRCFGPGRQKEELSKSRR